MIIVGGGPAGYTAALYTARANLEPLVFEGFQWGGQLQNTTDVENYPGYPDGIMGPEMMTQFRAQAERFGTRFVSDDVDRVELLRRRHPQGLPRRRGAPREGRDPGDGGGAETARVPGEMELAGRGVSTCGVCDGAFFKGHRVLVIGGGDSAMEDSIFISKFADELTIVNRRDEFRASKIMHDRALAVENIDTLTPYIPLEFVAGEDGKLAKVRMRHADTGEESEVEATGAFVAIGHVPRSEVVKDQVAVDEDGYIKVDPGSTRTNLERRLRGRRRRRPHLPPGGHRRRHRLHGRARRRALPARLRPRRSRPTGSPAASPPSSRLGRRRRAIDAHPV